MDKESLHGVVEHLNSPAVSSLRFGHHEERKSGIIYIAKAYHCICIVFQLSLFYLLQFLGYPVIISSCSLNQMRRVLKCPARL